MEFTEAIRINNERKARFDERSYNPLTGHGSHIPRFPVYIKTVDEKLEGEYMLPLTMENDEIVSYLLDSNVRLTNAAYFELMETRMNYDYEYYAVNCQWIKDKESGKNIPFRLNYPQRAILLKELEAQRAKGLPIRIVLVKARQWGGSTEINGYGNMIQTRLTTGWNSCIIGDVEEQARNIRAMYSNISKNFPPAFGKMTLKNFEGSSKNKYYAERDCVISIGSAQKPDSLRSGDIKIAHLSEVGLWKATEGKKPEDLVQSVRGSIPPLPLTMIALESTAKGQGNFFHREHKSALNPNSLYTSVFVPWWQIERYQTKEMTENDMYLFMLSWNDYEKGLWQMGATIEGIHWYRQTLTSEFKDDKWRMGSEFPSTVDEAFASTGRKVIPPIAIETVKLHERKPEFKGDMFAVESHGVKALEKLRFDETLDGEFWVWAKPAEKKYKNRYLVVMDIGGRYHKADPSVISVYDRYWASKGENLEVVARWRGRLDYHKAAWKAVQIASWYQDALLVIESNYVDNKNENNEGDNFLTILDFISQDYRNLYSRTPPEKIRAGAPVKYGYHTNTQTRPLAIGKLLQQLDDRTFTEPDYRAYDEMATFVYKDNGKMEHEDGCHDDILMTDAIACDVHESMEPCKEIKEKDLKALSKKNIPRGYSDFA